ncbi:hypothetical protein E8705_001394 [Escherichia coli]|nr:hypothetical protein [Escherichia coli]EED1581205.1 hypothetical protein [Escherichia coli]EES0429048.1 hypothetical protein [Escherichia coli]EET1489028.1 hypothetical protein [Escherichia coli]EEU1788656.1 hypothetical protein [Escherichia coli]
MNPNNTGKKQPLLFLAKLMVYSAALTFFTANFHCNMTRKINEYA